MSERALRGTRLGATSYESDAGIDFAPRQEIDYVCPADHRFTMPFSVEADVPPTWECKVCGATALMVDGTPPEEKSGKPPRTHWDMLLERRSVADLEEVLAERLEVLRAGGIVGGDPLRNAPSRTLAVRKKATTSKASTAKASAAAVSTIARGKPGVKPATVRTDTVKTAAKNPARKTAAHTTD
jgi:rubredoxin